MHDTFAGAMADFATRPVRNLRRLRSLSTFRDGEARDVIWALNDVSFEVKEGEVIGVIGSNGSGKTTLLKILSRITEPTRGRALVKGLVSSLLEVGTGFHPELTGRENIYLNGSILSMGRKEIDRKFDEIVDFSGVERFIDTPLKRYSTGMNVRLAFAVAAHLEPELLLVDEVLAVGDVVFQSKCLGKMQNVAREGRTILFVSHNMGQIRNLCERVILLSDGGIKSDGDSSQVIDEYVKSSIPLLHDYHTDRRDRITESDVAILRSFSIYGKITDTPPTSPSSRTWRTPSWLRQGTLFRQIGSV